MTGWGRQTHCNFVAESTSHFKILLEGYEHDKIDRKVTGILEDEYRFIGRKFNYFPSGLLTVVLYKDTDFYFTTGSVLVGRGG
jgi:hypothetical protein